MHPPATLALALTIFAAPSSANSGPIQGTSAASAATVAASDRTDAHLSPELFPGNVPLDARGRPTHAVTRIVDARTGAPLSDARVQVVFERERPPAGEFWSARTAEADDDGYVRVRLDDFEAYPWLYFEAPGHATRAELSRVPDPVIALEPGLDVEIEVRDPWERPIAGASIGRIIGCGHTPDAAVARTDERGRAVLRSVDTGHHELWPVAEGFESDYLELEPWLPGDPPLVLRLRYGSVVEGVVVDRDGKPVPRAFIGEPRTDRGPWTQADEQGHFRLVGASEVAALQVFAESGTGPPLGSFDSVRGILPVKLVVPNIDERTTPVRYTTKSFRTGEPASGVEVIAIRDLDGTSQTGLSAQDGTIVLELPSGDHTIVARGAGWDEIRRFLRVAGTPVDGTLSLDPWSTTRFDLEFPKPPSGRSIELISGRSSWSITELVDHPNSDDSVPIPRPGTYSVRISCEDRVRVSEPQGGWPSTSAEFPRATIVRATLVRADGAPALGIGVISRELELDPQVSLALRKSAARRDTLAISSWVLGRRWLVVDPIDEDLLPLRVPVVLRESDAELDLGVLRFASRTEPPLLVLRADGTPGAGAQVVIQRPGGTSRAELDALGALTTDLALRSGDRVSIEATDQPLPLVAELHGEAPWTLRWPAGTIEATAADEDGRALQGFVVLLDGASTEIEGELAHLSGVWAGPHRVIVTAPGRLAWIEDLELAEGATIEVHAVLPPR
jgi:hypothetical protein